MSWRIHKNMVERVQEQFIGETPQSTDGKATPQAQGFQVPQP